MDPTAGHPSGRGRRTVCALTVPRVVLQASPFDSSDLLLGWTTGDLLELLVVVGFFVGTGVAFVLRSNDLVRRTFLALFLLGLVVAGTTGYDVEPFVTIEEFSSTSSETRTSYEIRVVDASGREVAYDARAAPPMLDYLLQRQARRLVTGYTVDERRAVAAHLLDEAREYRSAVESRSPTRTVQQYLDFPRHRVEYRWTRTDLQHHDEFVGLRVYRIHARARVTDDGRMVLSRNVTRVYELRPDTSRPGEPRPNGTST